MASAVTREFPQAEQEKIAAAVREAEQVTAGEIVPYVVGQSDHYEAAEWRAGFICWCAAFLAMSLLPAATGAWMRFDALTVAAATLLAGAAGMLLARLVPPVRRLFAGKHLMARRVEQRAAEAFIAEEVFATPKRTGILIFLSLLERRVLVIGDAGINSRVAPGAWDGIIARVVAAIRSGAPADGLAHAIRSCGALLAGHGVGRDATDRDVLPDNLRVRKE